MNSGLLQEALRTGREIQLRSYVLRDQGEQKLEWIIHGILNHYGQADSAGPIHAAIREIVQNASKANLKRILFAERGLNVENSLDYEAGMSIFKEHLVKSELARYRPRLEALGMQFEVSFLHSSQVLIVSVVNHFPLMPAEERRIREKFQQSRSLDNLYDFFIQYGDATEGAGMGIAMVEILLEQAGLDRHNFVLYSTGGKTIARLVLPFQPAYRTPRQQFADLLTAGYSPEELRQQVRLGNVRLTYLS
ncbi:MAG: hypothetical protein HS115_05735 [Spirochaetales bacterium]|nr:hypothetical protein [Spirochaetales bacterium]